MKSRTHWSYRAGKRGVGGGSVDNNGWWTRFDSCRYGRRFRMGRHRNSSRVDLNWVKWFEDSLKVRSQVKTYWRRVFLKEGFVVIYKCVWERVTSSCVFVWLIFLILFRIWSRMCGWSEVWGQHDQRNIMSFSIKSVSFVTSLVTDPRCRGTSVSINWGSHPLWSLADGLSRYENHLWGVRLRWT